MMSFIKDLTGNIPLLVILCAILALIVALIIVAIAKAVSDKKKAKNAQTSEQTPSAPAEQSEEKPVEQAEEKPEVVEEKKEPEVQEPVEEKPEPQKQITEKESTEMKETKEKPQAKKPESKPAPAKKPVKPVVAPKVSSSVGKWIVFEEDRGGFGFRLVASNGEVMLSSSAPYASLSSAKSGIKTYQENIAADRMEIVETKKGNFFVQINNASKRLLATSADYKNRSSAENAMASIKRWSATAVITVETEEKK